MHFAVNWQIPAATVCGIKLKRGQRPIVGPFSLTIDIVSF